MKIHDQPSPQSLVEPSAAPDGSATLAALHRAMKRVLFEYDYGVADRDVNSYILASAAGNPTHAAIAREAIEEWAGPMLKAFREGSSLGATASSQLQEAVRTVSDLAQFLSLVLPPESAQKLSGMSESEYRGVMLSFHRLMNEALTPYRTPSVFLAPTPTSSLSEAPPLPKRDVLAEAVEALVECCGEGQGARAKEILRAMPDGGSSLINLFYRAEYFSALRGSIAAYGWGDPEHYQSVATIRAFNQTQAVRAASQRRSPSIDTELVASFRALQVDPLIAAAILTKAFTEGKHLVTNELPVQAIIAAIRSTIGGKHRIPEVKTTLIALVRAQVLKSERYRGDQYYSICAASDSTNPTVRTILQRAKQIAAGEA